MGMMMRIGDAAAILRCQVPRKKVGESDVHEWTFEDGGCGGLARFVPPSAGTPVAARLGERSRKFALRRHDILIGTGGTAKTVGMTAFVAFRPECAMITTKNMLIIRPDPNLIDPVWLYYRLAQADIQRRLAECASGGRSRYLPPGAIGDLEVRMPDVAEIGSVHAAHKVFMKSFWANSARMERDREEWERLAQALKANADMASGE